LLLLSEHDDAKEGNKQSMQKINDKIEQEGYRVKTLIKMLLLFETASVSFRLSRFET